jgi:predicted RNase H-like HicB family nuclease
LAAGYRGHRFKSYTMCYIYVMKREETIRTVRAQYLCTFRPERGGGYTVRCAAFPELVTNGRTLDEARSSAREALELCLEVYEDEGRPIPASDADPGNTINGVISVRPAHA